MREYLNPVIDLLNYQLFNLGHAQITPLSIIYLLLLTGLLLFVTRRLRDLLVVRLLGRTQLKPGARQAIGTISRYLMLLIGFVLILQTVGIDLTAFNVLAGAVGIGIGLGLQNIANNFISGLIILLERPIQIGDRIDISGVTGKVVSIGARSTRILTNDNIAIIVPNSKFVTENVVNWSYENETVRFKIPIVVAHESNIHDVERLMIEAAKEDTDVSETPPPSVRFIKIDDEGMYFELRAWSKTRLHSPAVLKSDLMFSIVDKLCENHIRLSRNQVAPNDWNIDAPSTNGSQRHRREKRAEMPLED
jgi:small-conductance mechanosensitive channel